MDLRKRINLSHCSDEEVIELMESIESETEDDNSSDDCYDDPDYEIDEISAEDEELIEQAVNEMENDSINFSLNMSQIDLDQSNKTVAIPHVLQLPTVYDFLPSTSTESTTQSSIQRRSTTPLPTQMIDQKKKFIEVDSPKIIREYNSHMGGVDLMDGLMGRYHIRIKSRDAIVRLFYHFLDMALTNSYVLYRRINAEKKDSNHDVEEKLLNLPEFREEIADKLVKFTEKKSVGRPKTSGKRTSVDEPLSPLPGSSAHGRNPKHPTEDLRYDGQDQFPRWLPKSGGKKQCKNSGCKSETQCVCTKRNLHLCCSTNKNCFTEYLQQE